MQAIAKTDFSLGLPGGTGKPLAASVVSDGEILTVRSVRMAGIVETVEGVYKATKAVTGYLVEIEGQTVFIDEKLIEVSKQE